MDSATELHSEDNLLIIKGRFKSSSQNLYGLFLFMFNNNKRLDPFHIIVSSYSDMYENEPHLGWEKYEEYIVDKKWKGVYNNSMTASLIDATQALAEDNRNIEILYDHIYNYDYDQMDIIIFDMINRIIHDKNLYMETIIQEISQDEYHKIREERSKVSEKSEEQDEPAGETKNIILQVKPIVAPVKGKPLYELKIGDQIMIKIEPETSKENYYIDLYDLRGEKNIKPVPGTVIDIKSVSGKNELIEILVEITPGIFGKFLEEEKQVKLKIFNPETDNVIAAKNNPTNTKRNTQSNLLGNRDTDQASGKSILVMALLFVIIIVLLIFLILII